MGIGVLLWLQDIRTPFLTAVMSFFTLFGEETIPLLIICFLYWCVNKRSAICAALNLFMGLTVNQALKAVFHVPRPWLLNDAVRPEETALGTATGYSFPSGHTANAVSSYGSFALFFRKRALTALCAALIALVALSRLYLGVHTPADVAGSLLIGCALLYASTHVLRWVDKGRTQLRAACAGGVAISVLLVLLTNIMARRLNDETALLLDAYKAAGGSLGFFAAFYVERTRIRFREDATPAWQLIKYLGGLTLVFLLLVGAKAPLNALLGDMAGSFVRYALVAFSAIAFWPFLFTRFARRSATNA